MGLKLRGVLRCGACGKPRGLGGHLCEPGKRRRRRTALQNPLGWECGRCRKPRGVRHTCTQRSDFAARKRKAATAERQRKRKAASAARTARRKQAAADRRTRDRARKTAAKAKPRKPRARGGDSHEPGTCGDRDCQKYGCRSYWQGMTDCPRPHIGD
jgi:hypothetical protein